MSCRERVSNGCSMSDRIPELRLKRHRPGFLVTGAQKAGTTLSLIHISEPTRPY